MIRFQLIYFVVAFQKVQYEIFNYGNEQVEYN